MSDLRETPYTGGFRLTFTVAVLAIAFFAFSPMEETLVSEINDKLEHAAAFFILAFLLDFASPRQPWGWRKLLPLFAYGLLIEWVQYFLPYRECSFWDLVVDTLALGVYPLALPLLKRTPGLALRWISGTN